jgi:Protein of unknown function (DUF1257)
MSHIVTIQTKLRDPAAISAACRRLELPAPVQGTARLFETEVSGLLVQLPQWLFPVVVDVKTGEARYDNYGGAWGDAQHLDRFVQRYAVELATSEARKKGYAVSEQALHDGSIRLQIVAAT